MERNCMSAQVVLVGVFMVVFISGELAWANHTREDSVLKVIWFGMFTYVELDNAVVKSVTCFMIKECLS